MLGVCCQLSYTSPLLTHPLPLPSHIHSPSPQELNLSHTYGPTDQAVFQLVQSCPSLKMLMLHSCPNVTGESRELLSQQSASNGRQRKFQQITWTIAL